MLMEMGFNTKIQQSSVQFSILQQRLCLPS